MDDRHRLAIGLVVGLLLVVSGFVPHPILASPYETSEPAPYLHQAVSEDDSQFDQLVALYGFTPDDAVALDDLSPTARDAVERTLADDVAAGEWRQYELPVCATGMLVCDSVREPPSEFHYGEGTPDDIFTIIDVDGDRYLLQTGVQTDARTGVDLRSQPLSTFAWLFGLLPFGALVIASHVIGRATGERRVADVLTAGGAGVLALGVAVPYLAVFGVVDYDDVAVDLLIVAVGMAALAVGGLVYQAVQYAKTTESAKRRRGE